MIDAASLTPYIMGAIGAVGGIAAWLCKQVVQLGKDVVALQTAFRYYLDVTSRGAANILSSPNPTPVEMRQLLDKHARGELNDSERRELANYLREVKDDDQAQKSKRNAAILMLAAIETEKILTRST